MEREPSGGGLRRSGLHRHSSSSPRESDTGTVPPPLPERPAGRGGGREAGKRAGMRADRDGMRADRDGMRTDRDAGRQGWDAGRQRPAQRGSGSPGQRLL